MDKSKEMLEVILRTKLERRRSTPSSREACQLVEGSGRVPSMFPRTVKETRNTNSNPGLSRIFLRYQWGRLGGHPWRDC